MSGKCLLCHFITVVILPSSAHLINTGGDNFNKRCFGTKPKLLRESGDFSGNWDTWKFFRETRYNSGTLQKKNLRIYVWNSKNFREGNPKIREDDPNFQDDLR